MRIRRWLLSPARRAVANILNKQSQVADTGRSLGLDTCEKLRTPYEFFETTSEIGREVWNLECQAS
jgi:hypothetical protein